MVTGVSNSLSAVKAAGTAMNVRANNIANVQSDGFKKTNTVMNEGEEGGVKVTLSRDNSPGPRVSEPDGTVRELSNTDIAEEFTQMMVHQNGYEANLKMIQADDEMKGTVIDMMA